MDRYFLCEKNVRQCVKKEEFVIYFNKLGYRLCGNCFICRAPQVFLFFGYTKTFPYDVFSRLICWVHYFFMQKKCTEV